MSWRAKAFKNQFGGGICHTTSFYSRDLVYLDSWRHIDDEDTDILMHLCLSFD